MMMRCIRPVTAIMIAALVCSAVWAGDLKATVVFGGAPVDGAIVRVDDTTHHGTTNAQGQWAAGGLAQGTYRVIAWKTIAGDLKGAIVDVQLASDAADADALLKLTDAVWLHEQIPLRKGNEWFYRREHTEAGVTTTEGRVERAVDTKTVNGDTAVLKEVSFSSGGGFTSIEDSDRDGYTVHAEVRTGDTMRYDPPAEIGDLLPLGYEWEVETRIVHSNGDPPQQVTLRCTLAGFDTVTVPAGTFADAARLEISMEVGGEVSKSRMWTAAWVGPVRVYEKQAGSSNVRILEEYHVVPPGKTLPVAPVEPIRRVPRVRPIP